MQHEWNISPAEAIALQKKLAPLVKCENQLDISAIHTIAGIDVAYKDDLGKATIVVLAFPTLEIREEVMITQQVTFPYVPGLFSFREGPIVLSALALLTISPDLLMFDGQGIAHPRRLGLAAHLGVYLDKPSIGCAKSRLIGSYAEPGPEVEDQSPLYDHEQIVGTVLRSKRQTRPLFISCGNHIDLPTAVAIVMQCMGKYRLPEPTYQADKLASFH